MNIRHYKRDIHDINLEIRRLNLSAYNPAALRAASSA